MLLNFALTTNHCHHFIFHLHCLHLRAIMPTLCIQAMCQFACTASILLLSLMQLITFVCLFDAFDVFFKTFFPFLCFPLKKLLTFLIYESSKYCNFGMCGREGIWKIKIQTKTNIEHTLTVKLSSSQDLVTTAGGLLYRGQMNDKYKRTKLN